MKYIIFLDYKLAILRSYVPVSTMISSVSCYLDIYFPSSGSEPYYKRGVTEGQFLISISG